MSEVLTHPHDSASRSDSVRNRVVLLARERATSGITTFVFARPDHSRLPDWAPGAHIDLVLPDGAVRQYSLCGDRHDPYVYRVAVQREADGRGGSRQLHDDVAIGDSLEFGGPRNNFRLAPAERYLFIAGGIGITPLLPMIAQADRLEADWRLLYLGRSRDRLAFLDELSAWPDRVIVHCADEQGRAELRRFIPLDAGVRVYACGPTRMLDAIEEWETLDGGFPAKVERFSAARSRSAAPSGPFEVTAQRSSVTTIVAPDESIVDALRKVGVDVLTSCAQGVCGTCETDVISGQPDHRDSLLDEVERQQSACMFPCVSRSRDGALILDL